MASFRKARLFHCARLPLPGGHGVMAVAHARVDIHHGLCALRPVWVSCMDGPYPARSMPHGTGASGWPTSTTPTTLEAKGLRVIPLERLIDALASLLESRGYHITLSSNDTTALTPRRLLAPDCLLPVLMRMAEETWKRQAGQVSFGLAVEPDGHALCGQRLHAIHHAPLSLLVLCTDQVLQKVADPHGLMTVEALERHADVLCGAPPSQPAAV